MIVPSSKNSLTFMFDTCLASFFHLKSKVAALCLENIEFPLSNELSPFMLCKLLFLAFLFVAYFESKSVLRLLS